VSLLGMHYGDSGLALAGYEYLDVGPTTDRSTNARPTTDGKVLFDDLVMFALNYSPAVSVARRGPHLEAGDVLSLSGPATVSQGAEFDVPVVLQGAADLQAISIALA